MEFDVLKIREETFATKSQANVIVSSKRANIERIGFRRFQDNRVFQTSRLGETNLDQLIKESKMFGGPGTPHDFDFAPAHSESRKSQSLVKSALESYAAALDELRSSFPNYLFSGECTVKNQTVTLNSSYGLDLSCAGSNLQWYFIYQRKGSGNVIDGFIDGTSGSDNILESVREHFIYLNDLKEVSDFKPGKYPVLFVENREILKKLIASFEVNRYQESGALYSGKLGQKLFDSRLSLVDGGYDPKIGHFQFFDGEGTVRESDLPLIENGIFRSLISNLRYQKKYGVTTTGNGLRPFDQGVKLGLRNLKIVGGEKKWFKIIKDLPFCVVAAVTAGGESNDLGEYSSPIQAGYLFKNGELMGLLPQSTVKTSIDRYLGVDLVDISSDGFTPDQGSACVISEMDIYLN
jgi:predicted Zn-dependent protease